MKGRSAVVCIALLVQSIGLSAPCMCDVGDVTAAPTHACCGGGVAEGDADQGAASAASPAQTAQHVTTGTLERRCGDACGCSASLSPTTLQETAALGEIERGVDVRSPDVGLQQARVGAWVTSTGMATWPPVERPPGAVGRTLAALQVWRC